MLIPSVIRTLHRFLENRKNFFHGYGFVVYPGGEDGGGELGERFGADGAAQGEVGSLVTGGDEPEVALPGLWLNVELKAELAASQSHGLPEQGAANHGVGKDIKYAVGGTAKEGFQHGGAAQSFPR